MPRVTHLHGFSQNDAGKMVRAGANLVWAPRFPEVGGFEFSFAA